MNAAVTTRSVISCGCRVWRRNGNMNLNTNLNWNLNWNLNVGVTETTRRIRIPSEAIRHRKRQRQPQRQPQRQKHGSPSCLPLLVFSSTRRKVPFVHGHCHCHCYCHCHCRYRFFATITTEQNDPRHPFNGNHPDDDTPSNNNNNNNDNNNDDDEKEEEFRPPRWLRRMQRKASSDQPMDSQRAYRYLGLEKFDDDELRDRFQRILSTGGGTVAMKSESSSSSSSSTSDLSPNSSDPLTQERLRSYLSDNIRREEKEYAWTETASLSSPYIDRLRTEYIEVETRRLWNFLNKNNTTATPSMAADDFVNTLRRSAKSIDKQRLGPLALSMVMIGLSVGVTTPAFPFVVQNLGLTTGEYGMVVSAFALTKLLGNIPFAVLVERDGRKPYLVYSLIAISTGVGCIGLASGFEELYACRLITGLGVAGLSCAATMSVTDISTPLNRASSFAPISAGFAAGTAMGPALGGILIDEIGVNPTFALVGGSFLMLGGVNSVLLDETMNLKKPRKKGFPWQEEAQEQQQQRYNNQTNNTINNNNNNNTINNNNNNNNDPENPSIQQAFQSALGQWAPLLSEAPVRNVCIINGFYWVALAGGQMTLLPLLLTDPNGLAMTATQVGQVYMGMSFVQVLGNPICGKVVDRVGTVPGIVGGCSMITAAMYALPTVVEGAGSAGTSIDDHRFQAMAVVLGLWAAGSSLLSTSPIAHIGNTVDDSRRAQAIALLRTAGDVGFLVGASSMGMVSDFFDTGVGGGLEAAMQSSATILGTATTWYIVRNLMTSKMQDATKTKQQ